GRYAYLGLTSVSGNDFRVVNISNPASPAVIGGADPVNTVRKVVVAGKYAYAGFADTVGADMMIYDINGIDAPSASIGSMGVEVLYVGRSATIAQSLNVIGSLNVGIGGIKSDGMLSITVGSGATISGMTGAVIQNRGFTGTVLALDSWRFNGTGASKIVPHLLFGYRGTYDTMLYRAGTGVLANSGTMLLRGGTGRTLLKIETQMNSSAGANVMEVFSNVATGFGAANHNRVLRMDAGGGMYSDGSFSGGGADYAERFLSSTPNLKPGQLVCLDPLHSNTVKLCDRSGDTNVMGIISTKPAFVGDKYRGGDADGKSDKNSAIVGLIGQLPAKAIVEDGQAIAVGDALAAAAKPGFVRKAKAGESTVGVALSPLASGEGDIDVLITRRNQSDLVEKIENEVTQSIADMHIEDDVRAMVQTAMNGANINGAVQAAVQAQVQSLNLAAEINAILNQRLADGSLNLGSNGTLSTDIYAALQSHSGSLSIQNAIAERLGITRTGTSALMLGSDLLVAGAVTVQQDVMIGGTLHAAAIQGPIRFDGPILPGSNFAIGAMRMTGSTVSIGSITQSGALEVLGNVTISGLATFLGQVEVKGELIVSSNQAGFAVIPAHTKAVAVSFGTGFVSTPVINATPNGRVGSEWWIDSQTQTGFVIRTDKSVTQDVRFSWTALGVRNAGTSTGQAGAVSLIPFHVDAAGRPFSTVDNVWNACIRDPNSLDACRGYHQGSQWFFHPDIVAANQEVLSFTYDAAAGPSSLVIPSSYETQVIEQEILSSSSSVSSEASSSVSSVASSQSSASAEPETGTGGALSSSESSASSESGGTVSSEASSSSVASSESSSSEGVGQ
ncbi:MAG TPA: hypothetical protein PKV72_01970, partial [Candidatus Peribacteria bacterium]|nr:hypothetical protein [Candidatus Peribacteria bacterium]